MAGSVMENIKVWTSPKKMPYLDQRRTRIRGATG